MILHSVHIALQVLIACIGFALTEYGLLYLLGYLRYFVTGNRDENPTRGELVRRCLYLGLGMSILLSRF